MYNEEKELLAKLKEVALRKEELEDKLKEVNKEFAVAYSKLHQHLIDNGKECTSEYAGIGKVRLMPSETIASVKSGHMEELEAYLKQEDRLDLIKPTVHWKALSSFVNELMVDGRPLPNCIDVYSKPKLRMMFK